MTEAVVVDVPSADTPALNVDALIDSCTTGLHSSTYCILGPEKARATAVAFFTWVGPAHDQARVNVVLRLDGTARWRSRLLSFSPDDPDIERWRTVGFAVATLVGEAFSATVSTEKSERQPKTAEQTPEVIPVYREVEKLVPNGGARSWVDAGFTMSRGALGFSPAEGGDLRLTRTLGAGGWFTDAALALTVQRLNVDSIALLRPSASAGGGAVLLRLAGFAVALRADATVELVSVAGRDPATGIGDHGERWWFGFRQRIDASWMWSSQFGVVAGVAGVEMTSSAMVEAHSLPVARIAQFDLLGECGLRFKFP